MIRYNWSLQDQYDWIWYNTTQQNMAQHVAKQYNTTWHDTIHLDVIETIWYDMLQ